MSLFLTRFASLETREYIPPDPAAGDPYWDSVGVLLHMNGSDGSTTFVDEKEHTTSAMGGAVLTTLHKRFGSAGGDFSTGGYVLVNHASDLTVGSSAFTVEAFVNFPELPTTTGTVFGSLASKGTYNDAAGRLTFSYHFYRSGTGYQMRAAFESPGGSGYVGLSTAIPLTANNTFHVAYVKSGNKVEFYFEGVKYGEYSISSIATLTDNTRPLSIGAGEAGQTPMNAYIDEFRFTKALRYTGNFTVPTIEFPNYPAENPDAGPSDTYWNEVVALLHMDGTAGTSAFVDEKGHTVTNVGTPTISSAQAKFGQSASVSSGNTLRLAGHSDYALNGDFTIEGWFYKPTGTISNITLFANETYAQAGNGNFLLRLTSSSEILWASYDGLYSDAGSNSNLLSGPCSFTLANWHHVALAREGTTLRCFLNGTVVFTGTESKSLNANMVGINIGGPAFSNNDFAGYIDDVRITKGVARYKAAFTVPTEAFPNKGAVDAYWDDVTLLAHMNGANGTTTITDEKANVITSSNATINTTISKFGGASLSFNGTNSYATAPYTNAKFAWWLEDFTIECWVHPTDLTKWSYTESSTPIPVMIGNAAFNSTANYWAFGPLSTGKLGFYYYNGSPVLVQSTELISTGVFTHIAMTKTSAGIRLWVNGVGTAAVPVSGTPQSYETGGPVSIPLVIGMINNRSAAGYIDELRITKGFARYTENFTVPTEAFPSRGNYTKFLSHFDGTNGSTTFTDFKGHVLTANAGATITTAVSKFGGASANLSAGGYLTVGTPDDLRPGANNFTFEMFAQKATLPSAGVYATLMQKGTIGASNFEFRVGLLNDGGSYKMVFSYSTDGTTLNEVLSTAIPLTASAMHHFSWDRQGTTIRFFFKGVMYGTATIPATLFSGSGTLSIGSNPTGVDASNAYIDELRMTVGDVVHTANFTVPSAAYTD